MDNAILQQNLRLLEKTQPRMAALIRASEGAREIRVTLSESGQPVPTFGGQGYHSLENPKSEAAKTIDSVIAGQLQNRILLVGFGFGYPAKELCRRGFSPLVYEPDLGMLNLAFRHVDFTEIIPYTTFYGGPILPSIPPRTTVLTHPFVNDLYPLDAIRLRNRAGEEPPKTNDVTEGEKCETYRNVSCLKNPVFLSCYQMILSLVRPNVLIEVGTCRGGAALFYADFLKEMGGKRHVYTIDIFDDVAPEVLDHPNITFFPGGHANFDLSFITPEDRVLIIEDSAHTYENTIEVLNRFHSLVTENSYFIVEDTITENPIYNGGPMRAVNEFLSRKSPFERDRRWETYYGPELENHCVFLRRLVTSK